MTDNETYAERTARLTQERRRAAKKRRRRELATSIAAGALVVVGVVLLIAAVIGLGGVITMLAWNLGVVTIAAACGASVGEIGFVTAIFANIAISILGRIVNGSTRAETKPQS